MVKKFNRGLQVLNFISCILFKDGQEIKYPLEYSHVPLAAQPALWLPPAPRHHGCGSVSPSSPAWPNNNHTAVCDQHCPGWYWVIGRAHGSADPVMANNCVQCDTLAKHSPYAWIPNRHVLFTMGRSEKHAAFLSILIKEFEIRLQEHWNNHQFFFLYICNSVFSHTYNTCEFSNAVHRAAIRHSTQKSAHVSTRPS